MKTDATRDALRPQPSRAGWGAAVVVLAAAAAIAAVFAATAGARTVWLCRPGLAGNPCLADRTATVFSRSGTTSVQVPKASKGRRIDCFYVYPTVSGQSTANANLHIDPGEIWVARSQASRFAPRCRIYAPMYRQVTVGAVAAELGTPGTLSPAAAQTAYSGVLAGWRTYLRRYNHRRGVVLIGHSQGAYMLTKPLRDQISRHRSVRRRLVSALLIGGNVRVRKGSDTGGDLRHLHACHSARQVGCVVAYSSFNEPPPPDSVFGRVGGPADRVLPLGQSTSSELRVLCVNPAAPAGGTGGLNPFFGTTPPLGIFSSIIETPAPTPWAAFPNLYSAHCKHADGAHWLQVDDVGGPGDLRPRVHQTLGPAWGLHLYDVNLAIGNLVRMVRSETRAYLRRAGRG
jgi:hypothetical protein